MTGAKQQRARRGGPGGGAAHGSLIQRSPAAQVALGKVVPEEEVGFRQWAAYFDLLEKGPLVGPCVEPDPTARMAAVVDVEKEGIVYGNLEMVRYGADAHAKGLAGAIARHGRVFVEHCGDTVFHLDEQTVFSLLVEREAVVVLPIPVAEEQPDAVVVLRAHPDAEAVVFPVRIAPYRIGAGIFGWADLVIRNSRLLIGDGTVVEAATIVIDGGRIAALGEDVGAWQGVKEIDAAGRTVMPGLIDTHVHLLALVSESAESVARYRRERLPSVLSGFLARGVTTIRSTGDPLPAITEVREELRSGTLDGPRLLTSGPVLAAQDGHPAVTVCGGGSWAWCRENLVRELQDAEGARRAVAELAGQSVDFIKVVYEGMLGAKLELAVLEAIVQEARACGLKVVVHGVPGKLAMEAVEAGADGLVHLPFGPVELPALVEAMRDYPISSTLGVLTPVEDEQGNLHGPYGNEWNENSERARRAMLQAAAALWEARVRLAFGTDTPMFPPEQSWLHEAGALLEAGLTPSDVVIMATRNAARALGLEDQLGTLEKGKRADLLMVDGHPDADLEALESITLVVKNGAVVVDRR